MIPPVRASSGYPVSGASITLRLGESFPPSIQSSGDMAHACRISSQKTLSYREVSQFMGSLNWASGLIPLGHLHLRPLQHFHLLGLTNRFSTPWCSNPVVLATLHRQWQNLSFLTSGIPIRPFQVEFTIFTDASTQGWGRPHGPILNSSSTSMYWSSGW